MTYETKIDELVSSYVAEFQRELLLAHELQGYLDKTELPDDYPTGIYHPKTKIKPLLTRFIAQTGGRLSNRVPRVLSGKILDDYPLGVYCPKHSDTAVTGS